MKKAASIIAILALLTATFGEIALAMRNSSDAKNITAIQNIISNSDDDSIKEILTKTVEKSGIKNVDQLNPKDSENAMVFSFLAGIFGLIVLVSLFFRKSKVSTILSVILLVFTAVVYFITPQIEQTGITAKGLSMFSLLSCLIGVGLYYYAYQQSDEVQSESYSQA